MRSCCQTRLSRNLFVGDGALDVPFGNIANSPKVEKNAGFSRRGVEGAAPYDCVSTVPSLFSPQEPSFLWGKFCFLYTKRKVALDFYGKPLYNNGYSVKI